VQHRDFLHVGSPVGVALQSERPPGFGRALKLTCGEEAALACGVVGVSEEAFADPGLPDADLPFERLDVALRPGRAETLRDEKLSGLGA
jgi:hypothetical protein